MATRQNKKRVLVDGALVTDVNRAGVMLGGACRDTVYQLIKAGELESYLEGRMRRITVDSIRAYIERQLAKQREFVRYRRYPNDSRAPP
jgi:excisionase family DNA binding protein